MGIPEDRKSQCLYKRETPTELSETFLVCWTTLPADLKNWDFEKKKDFT